MSFCIGTSHDSSTGLYLRLPKAIPKTSTFRDSYFPRIVQMWNALPSVSSLELLCRHLKVDKRTSFSINFLLNLTRIILEVIS